MDEIVESLVIGQDWPPGNSGDIRVVLFVHLRDGLTLDDALADRIRQHIRANTTPRHVPAKIVQVTDIPRTKSGKIVELAVRNVVHDIQVRNIDALGQSRGARAISRSRRVEKLMNFLAALAALGLEQWRAFRWRDSLERAFVRYARTIERKLNGGTAQQGLIATTIVLAPPVIVAAGIFWLLTAVHPLLDSCGTWPCFIC
jgi:hypothetical protein